MVEGSVFRSGNRVRVTAQLIHAPSDRLLWSGTYEREIKDLLALQGEMVATIAQEVKAKVTPAERARLGSPRALDPEAYEAYLRGYRLYNTAEERDLAAALDEFQRALTRDDSFALAYVGVADVHTLLASNHRLNPREGYARAQAAAQQGPPSGSKTCRRPILRSPSPGWSWTGTGPGPRLVSRRPWSWLQARPEPMRNTPGTWRPGGRPRPPWGEMKRAKELDPLSPMIAAGIGGILMYAHRTDEAIEQNRRALELNPGFMVAEVRPGPVPDSAEGRRSAGHRQPEGGLVLGSQQPVHPGRPGSRLRGGRGCAGVAKDARALWEDANPRRIRPSGAEQPMLDGALGHKAEAFALLERAYRDKLPGMVWLKVDTRFDPLRSDKRFQELLKRLGLWRSLCGT